MKTTRRNTGEPALVEYNCQLCGVKFPVPHHGGKGRPPSYCSKECREASAAMSTLDKWLSLVARRATPSKWQHVRHRLWSLANASPAFQQEMSRRAREKRAAIKAVPEARERQKKAARPAFVVTIGTAPVSDEVFATEAAAGKFARAFSVEHPGTLVDVRTAVAREKRGHFRDGKRVPLFHANPRGGKQRGT